MWDCADPYCLDNFYDLQLMSSQVNNPHIKVRQSSSLNMPLHLHSKCSRLTSRENLFVFRSDLFEGNFIAR